MAAIPAALAWIGAGLGLGHIGATDGLLDNLKRKQQPQQQQPQPIYHIQTGGGSFGLGSLFTAAAIGGGVVVFFGAYKYFWGANPLDKILPELEESSRKTLDSVRKADENQAVRAQQIDENNRARLQQLRTEIQGEQRGNFEVLSEQISCLTQIALQTMTHTTPGGPQAITASGNADEQSIQTHNKRTEELHQWAAEAQKVVDEISDPNYHEQKRKDASRRIRATIPNYSALTENGEIGNESSMGGIHDLRVDKETDGGRPKRRGGNSSNKTSGMMGALGYFFSN